MPHIQNEEVLIEVLETNKEFFIQCKDKADAQSKLVSLTNAKRKLTIPQQRKLKILKTAIDNIWGVKVSPASLYPIYMLVNGKRVPYTRKEEI